MRLIEDEHRSEADGLLAAGTNVDTEASHGADKTSGVLGVEGNEGALALTTEVLNVLGVLGGKALNLGIELVTDASGLLDQVLVKDLLDDGTGHDDTGRVTDPASFG